MAVDGFFEVEDGGDEAKAIVVAVEAKEVTDEAMAVIMGGAVEGGKKITADFEVVGANEGSDDLVAVFIKEFDVVNELEEEMKVGRVVVGGEGGDESDEAMKVAREECVFGGEGGEGDENAMGVVGFGIVGEGVEEVDEITAVRGGAEDVRAEVAVV
ncbi:hypothetical protein AGMMS49936_07250 [Endomicrobiia bacterium]|nr:hypothetical protein AGMMS49936_07250 [Endomicrobiia bacterium]